jgi:hypothetical protein
MGPLIQLLLSALGGAIVALVGNFILQNKTRSWQREQWLLDHKTAEYRELLSTLAQSVECMAQNSPHFGMALKGMAIDGQRDAYEQAAGRGKAIIRDRIFVAQLVADEQLLDQWQALAGARDMSEFWNQWEILHRTIVKAARKDLGVKDELLLSL